MLETENIWFYGRATENGCIGIVGTDDIHETNSGFGLEDQTDIYIF